MKPLCIVSLALNALVVLLVVHSLSRTAVQASFFDMSGGGQAYATGVCAVSVPEETPVVFSPVAFSLKPGAEAALQFSALRERKQLVVSLEPLYDHDIVRVEQTAWGLRIRALKPGEAVLQTFTAEGIRDLARITVE